MLDISIERLGHGVIPDRVSELVSTCERRVCVRDFVRVAVDAHHTCKIWWYCVRNANFLRTERRRTTRTRHARPDSESPAPRSSARSIIRRTDTSELSPPRDLAFSPPLLQLPKSRRRAPKTALSSHSQFLGPERRGIV